MGAPRRYKPRTFIRGASSAPSFQFFYGRGRTSDGGSVRYKCDYLSVQMQKL